MKGTLSQLVSVMVAFEVIFRNSSREHGINDLGFNYHDDTMFAVDSFTFCSSTISKIVIRPQL